jgi:hypothetical protein
MTTLGEFLGVIEQTDNFAGSYTLKLVQKTTPEDEWEHALGKQLTPEVLARFLGSVRPALEEVRGYYETDDGVALVNGELVGFLSEITTKALELGVEVTD